MSVSIKKETFERMHKYCTRGEKHDSFVNRLIDIYGMEEQEIGLSEQTIERLLKMTGCNDIDEALNVLMDRFRKEIK